MTTTLMVCSTRGNHPRRPWEQFVLVLEDMLIQKDSIQLRRFSCLMAWLVCSFIAGNGHGASALQAVTSIGQREISYPNSCAG
jgi:hypothetical protein